MELTSESPWRPPFARRAPIRIANLDAIETLVTDEGIPADFAQLIRDRGVRLEVVQRELSRVGGGGIDGH